MQSKWGEEKRRKEGDEGKEETDLFMVIPYASISPSNEFFLVLRGFFVSRKRMDIPNQNTSHL